MLAEEKDISVREAERWLGADVYLTECDWWVPFRLYCCTGCLFMLWTWGRKSMTMPSAMAGGSHCLCETWAEPSMVELIYANSVREKIAKIYWDMYQLQWLPGKMPCDVEKEEHLHQEILDSIKECLWHKWDPRSLEELRCPARIPRCDPQADYSAQNHGCYDWLKDTM